LIVEKKKGRFSQFPKGYLRVVFLGPTEGIGQRATITAFTERILPSTPSQSIVLLAVQTLAGCAGWRVAAKTLSFQLHFAIAFCDGTLLGAKLFLTKLRGHDGALGAVDGHV
jgi:hypothetical protein